MSASFCVEKYMRMAIVEHIRKERPDYSDKLVNKVADESIKHLSSQPMRAWSRAIEIADECAKNTEQQVKPDIKETGK